MLANNCRYCFDSYETENLVDLCYCKNLVCKLCLKKELLNLKNSNKNLNCSICKFNYSNNIILKKNCIYRLLNVLFIKKNFNIKNLILIIYLIIYEIIFIFIFTNPIYLLNTDFIILFLILDLINIIIYYYIRNKFLYTIILIIIIIINNFKLYNLCMYFLENTLMYNNKFINIILYIIIFKLFIYILGLVIIFVNFINIIDISKSYKNYKLNL